MRQQRRRPRPHRTTAGSHHSHYRQRECHPFPLLPRLHQRTLAVGPDVGADGGGSVADDALPLSSDWDDVPDDERRQHAAAVDAVIIVPDRLFHHSPYCYYYYCCCCCCPLISCSASKSLRRKSCRRHVAALHPSVRPALSWWPANRTVSRSRDANYCHPMMLLLRLAQAIRTTTAAASPDSCSGARTDSLTSTRMRRRQRRRRAVWRVLRAPQTGADSRTAIAVDDYY